MNKSFNKKEKKVSLYLGHPFDARKEVREWELEIEKKIGIELFNPFYDVGRIDVIEMDAGRKERYDIDPKIIILNDVQQIKLKEGMISIINGALSYGTIQEMVYSRFLKKPVYSLITNGHENHPWLRYHSTKIFTDKKNLEEFLFSLVNNGKNNAIHNKKR